MRSAELRRLALLAMILWLVGGCAYRVRMSSIPSPAEVTLPTGETVTTPVEHTFRWVPFGRQIVEVRAPGYRVMVVDLRRHEIRGFRYVLDPFLRPGVVYGQTPRANVGFVLVPLHGPAGTWAPEDAP